MTGALKPGRLPAFPDPGPERVSFSFPSKGARPGARQEPGLLGPIGSLFTDWSIKTPRGTLGSHKGHGAPRLSASALSPCQGDPFQGLVFSTPSSWDVRRPSYHMLRSTIPCGS